MHAHLGGRHAASGGDLAGEETGEMVGGFDDCAVAGNVGHGREGVKRLRARQRARDAVHACTQARNLTTQGSCLSSCLGKEPHHLSFMFEHVGNPHRPSELRSRRWK